MAWCEKCKMEYREGITVCADCGAQLVEELSKEVELIPLGSMEKEEVATRLLDFLDYSNVKTAIKEFNEEENVWTVSVAKEEEKQTKKLFQAFYLVEQENRLKEKDKLTSEIELQEEAILEPNLDLVDELDESLDDSSIHTSMENPSDVVDVENMEESQETLSEQPAEQEEILLEKTINLRTNASSTYVKKQDQYNDLKFTSYTFIGFGIAGLIFVILNILTPLSILGNPLSLIIMTGMVIGFIVVGISSHKKSTVVKTEIGEEDMMTTEINRFLEANITEELLQTIHDDSLSDEVNFFNKTERMKEYIVGEFGELDESYIDQLIEEFYNERF